MVESQAIISNIAAQGNRGHRDLFPPMVDEFHNVLFEHLLIMNLTIHAALW